jgi:hypothetical protein
VRKFFEILKEGTASGVVDRIFITGVSPITLDSLTSGYNIGTDLTRDFNMHDFMGFTEAEVAGLLEMAGVPEGKLEAVMADVRDWYNGYRFNRGSYVPALQSGHGALLLLPAYAQYGKYPTDLLDSNVASDYGKISRMFRVGDEQRNYALLEEIIEQGECAELTDQFSFERPWTRGDFASLLFYMGC